MLERRSLLASRLAAGGRDGLDGTRALRLAEVRGAQLLQIGTYPRATDRIEDAVRSTLGTGLPQLNDRVLVAGAHRLYRIAADQYWVLSTEPGVAGRLASALPPSSASLTLLDDARARVSIRGAATRALLSRLVSIDLRPAALPPGAFAQTAVHHVGALVDCLGEQHVELFLLKTYAASSWDVIVDAALPFGYDIEISGAPPA